jgi:tight adherence protein B
LNNRIGERKMNIIVSIVFVGVFAAIALFAAGISSALSRGEKQAAKALEERLAKHCPAVPEVLVDFRKSEVLSTIPWVNHRLACADVVSRLRRLMTQADVHWTVGKLLLSSVAGFAITGYAIDTWTGRLLMALVAGAVIGGSPMAIVLVKRHRRFAKFEQALPDALDLIVGALRVGHSFSAALGLVAKECADPVGSEFRISFDEHNYGLELRAALENLITRVPLQDLRIAVTAILIQRESGGNLAEVLEKISYVTRQRFRLKRQVIVHTAQGRLTGWVLTLLPIALGVGLYVVNPDTMSLLWRTDIGVKLLYGAGAMLVVGTLLIQKIVHMEV